MEQNNTQTNQPPAAPASKPHKERLVAGIFAILLGCFGAHKFYLGDTGMGILYLIFFWTGIPALVGLIEGILYLVMSDAEFQAKYGA